MPPLWEWVQVITLADATTFENYMTNMRNIMTDPMKEADLILINRCQPDFRKSYWRKQMRAMNPPPPSCLRIRTAPPRTAWPDEDLPYDMKADVIDITDDQLGIFLPGLHGAPRALRRKVRAVGQPFPHARLPKGFYFFGRYAMTCCANDIQKAGWICKGSDPTPPVF